MGLLTRPSRFFHNTIFPQLLNGYGLKKATFVCDLSQGGRVLRRWNRERMDRFFREDVRDLSSLELLADMLQERVGSLLPLQSLREDLEVSHRAISHWMDILERLTLRYFGERLNIPYMYQLTFEGEEDYLDGGVRVMPAGKFLAALP
ncbi:MAG: hypothetical protein JRI26_07915 [Deltaproteobacteria bacterium]|nr:hypothetical protein [Deltaproteobacteria bacterium]